MIDDFQFHGTLSIDWWEGHGEHPAEDVSPLAVMGGFGLVLDRVVRTGRRGGKRSAQGAALTTSPYAAGHETTRFDLFPSRSAAGKGIGLEVWRIRAGNFWASNFWGLFVLIHRLIALIHFQSLSLVCHVCRVKFAFGPRHDRPFLWGALRHPILCWSASRFHRYCHPLIDRSAGRRERKPSPWVLCPIRM